MTSAEKRLERWSIPEPNSGCVLWLGHITRNGYGRMIVKRPGLGWRNVGTHRLAWELEHGAIPSGLMVCHHCDTRSCVNPRHLFLGTAADNAADCKRKGRTATGSGPRWQRARGSRQGAAKLTEADIPKIRAAAASGESHRLIAIRFGVSRPTIWQIVSGGYWRHV